MKTHRVLLLCSTLLFSGVLFSSHQDSGAIIGKLPPQIGAFYDDLNFVGSFSSPPERSELAGYLTEKLLPMKFRDERLRKIFHLMKKIRSSLALEDSKMFIKEKPGIDRFFPSELVRIGKTQSGGGKIKAEVAVFYLEPKANLLLIAQYEKARGEENGLPSLEERLSLSGPGLAQRQEIHTWIQMGGEWKKQLANLVLVK